MAFRDDNPNWKLYSDEQYYMKTVPDDFWPEFEGLAFKGASLDIKSVINHLAEVIPCSPTTNWGGDFLRNDLMEELHIIRKKVEDGKIYVLMDCLAVLVNYGALTCNDINELFEDHNIGYLCERGRLSKAICWEPKENNQLLSQIEETKSIVKSVSQQAYDSFESAKRSLEAAEDERARKDAVRSCLDAVEAIVKEYGKDSDIKQASKNLRTSGVWGLDEIVKDGDAMFSNMHRLYPDLRHGSTETSAMSMEEAEYWIGRFSTYLLYMKKMAGKNGAV